MVARARRRLIVYLPHRQPIWMLPGVSLENIRRRAMKHFDIEVPMNEAAFARALPGAEVMFAWGLARRLAGAADALRSEEHTSELQSLAYLVCRLLLEKKKPTKALALHTRERGLTASPRP